MLKEKRNLKILMLGLRGFPDVQGGVETHCEHLCPELIQQGCDVIVLTRSPYTNHIQTSEWCGVRFKKIWAPKSKGMEAIAHTLIGVLYAALNRPDILHIQAIGPSIWTPLARILGLRVVVTHHGPDYDRQKWGKLAKFILRTGELFGMRYANDRIVISKTIESIVGEKYKLLSKRIPNGVVLPELNTEFDLLNEYDITSQRYILIVSRLVKEKRHLDLIEAFKQSQLDGWKLVIVGDSDHPDEYVKKVKMAADSTSGVVLAGYQTGQKLKAFYNHAGIFVLPSSHEGLPIALLEALSFGLPVVASNIPANEEVGLSSEHYFSLGDISELKNRLEFWSNQTISDSDRESRRSWVMERYDWHQIAKDTYSVYCGVVNA